MARRPPTGSKGIVPPSTAKHGAGASMMPTTARPSTRPMIPGTSGGAAGALSSMIRVADRPVTQQGLSGMKTASQGPNRQVLDGSYFLGLLRSKIQEISQEIATMNAEIDAYNQDNASFLVFENKAEQLAKDIKGLRGEMADFNTLMDKLNTDAEIDDIKANYHSMYRKNEQDARDIDKVFSQKQENERELEVLNTKLEAKKKDFDDMMSSMNPEDMKRYHMLKENNDKITLDLKKGQETLDSLTAKIEQQNDELSLTPVKQEILKLRQELNSVKCNLKDLEKIEAETPQQEQERLLQQVKADNQEIRSLEKRCSDLEEQLASTQRQLQQATNDLSHLHGERSEQYKDLRTKEKGMKAYFEAFESSCSNEKQKMLSLESDVAIILDHISQNIAQSEHMPSVETFQEMQANLGFKQDELGKTQATSLALDEENAKLEADLHKVEDLETKIKTELDELKDNIVTMSEELVIYKDLEGLHITEEEKRKKLSKEKDYLTIKIQENEKSQNELTAKYEAAKDKLDENDTYCQLKNLEHKWQMHEQSNFGMKEFISIKQSEGNYVQVSSEVANLIADYNKLLCTALSGPHVLNT